MPSVRGQTLGDLTDGDENTSLAYCTLRNAPYVQLLACQRS